MMKVSVAISIESMGGGGAQLVVNRLISGLLKMGFHIHLITLQSAETDFFAVPENVERHVIGGHKRSSNPISALYSNLSRIFKLRRTIRNANPKCVISFVSTHNILTLLACKSLNTPVIISERNDPQRQYIGPIWSLLRRLSYPSAAFVTANSKIAIKFLEKLVPADRLRLVQNPIRTFTPPKLPIMPEPFFLAVGRLNRQKAFDTLIEAYAIALFRAATLPTLLIIGKGPERQALNDKILQLGLSNKVVLAGEVANVGDYYYGALALLHPARFEGMPNVVLEAMATGTPVVVSNSQDSIVNLVSNDVSAMIFDTNDINQLAEIIVKLNDDLRLCKRLGLAAKAAVIDRLKDDGVSDWVEIIASVASISVKGGKLNSCVE